jgi:hypothetical protein
MPFTVEDFRDLIRLLEERPEWRVELRSLLLTQGLLALPDQVAAFRAETDRRFRELVEAQQRTEVQVAALAEAQKRTEAEVASLAEAQKRAEVRLGQMEERTGRLEEALACLTETQQHTEVQVAGLIEAQQQMTAQLAALTRVVRTLTDEVRELKGDSLERRYRDRAVSYFARLVRRCRVLSPEEVAALCEDSVAQGLLSVAEAEDVTWADLVVRGRRREDGQEVLLVVEISWGVGPQDVERAAARAALLSKAGLAALPVVAGKTITDEADRLARTRQVWQVLDGHALSPPEDPSLPDHPS